MPGCSGSLPGARLLLWVLLGEEEELELLVSCAQEEFNISSSGRAAPICCRWGPLIFMGDHWGRAECS